MSDAHQPLPEITAAPDLPARLEQLLQLVAQQGREIIITQEGRPVARLVPYAPQPGDPPFPPPAAPSRKDAGPPAQDAESNPDPFGAYRESYQIVTYKKAVPAQGPDEPPIFEDIVEVRDAKGNVIGQIRFNAQVLGDITAPIDGERDAESNPDPFGADRDILRITGDKNAAPAQGQEEPPILEDIIEIKDAEGNVIRRTRFTLQIFGDIDSPIDVEWDAESNPDRVLNPC